MRELGTPLTIHQPSYSLLNRWVEVGEPSLLQACHQADIGTIVFSPLSQGILTDRYLVGVPADSRAAASKSLDPNCLTEEVLQALRELNQIAHQRGQSLAQMALAWVLRNQGPASVDSALIGASSVKQLEANLAATQNTQFDAEELHQIDAACTATGWDIWTTSEISRD